MGERADQVSERGDYDDIRVSGAFSSLAPEGAQEARRVPAPVRTEEPGTTPSTREGGGTIRLEEDIEQTRAELSGTIEAIQDRLAPERITDQAMDAAVEATDQAREAALAVVDHAVQEAKAAVRELTDQAKSAVCEATVGRVKRVANKTGQTAQGFGSSVITTIKQNPGPAALAGLGLSWLWLSGRNTGNQGQQSAQSTGYQGYQGYQGYPSTSSTGYPSPSSGTGDVAGVASQAANQIQGTAGQVAGHVQDTVGAAVGQVQGTAEQVQGAVGDAASQARETAGQMAGQAQETASQVAEQVQRTVGDVAGQVQGAASQAAGQVQGTVGQLAGQVQSTGARVRQAVVENPIPASALGLVLGGVVGLAAPKTAREEQLLGEARDTVINNAQETAQDVIQKVQRVAEEAEEMAEKEARYQGLTPDR